MARMPSPDRPPGSGWQRIGANAVGRHELEDRIASSASHRMPVQTTDAGASAPSRLLRDAGEGLPLPDLLVSTQGPNMMSPGVQEEMDEMVGRGAVELVPRSMIEPSLRDGWSLAGRWRGVEGGDETGQNERRERNILQVQMQSYRESAMRMGASMWTTKA
jgi:hypothetical protein